MMKKILSTIIFLMSTILAFAQNIRVEAPNIVTIDEQFNITFIIENKKPSNFEWEQGSDFQLLWGPQTGSSRSVQIINGKRSSSSQFTYTYIISPKKAGKFTLPRAKANVGGEEWLSPETTIEVISNGSAASGTEEAESSESNNNAGEKVVQKDVEGKDLFLKLIFNKTQVVVGEPIMATLKLYQKSSVSIAGFEDAKLPTFTGCWSQETYAPTNIQFQRENVNDMMYNSAVLRRYVIIPQQVGKLKVSSSELVCLVNIRAPQRRATSIFDSFFDDGYTTVRKRLISTPVAINVQALPGGAPASFSGGVGQFNISAKLSKSDLNMHEAGSLLVTVSGNGNLTLLDAPKVNFPPDFEVYDTKVTENTDKSTGNTSGSKTFEFPFIPRSYGEFEIEPIKFAYYDVNSKKYVQLETQPIKIDVAKGNGVPRTQDDAEVSQPIVQQNGVKNLAEDIRFIETKLPSMSSSDEFFINKGLYWLIIGFLVILAIILNIVMMRVMSMRSDVVGARKRGAERMAKKKLKAAFDYLKKNEYSAFYEELHRALLGFISDKFNMKVEDLNKDNISLQLKEVGTSDEIVNKFIKLVDACEFARYAPDAGQEAMNLDYNEAVDVLSSIGSNMKKKNIGGVVALILLLICPAFQAQAQTNYPDSLWTVGVKAYDAGNWGEAANAWSGITMAGIKSAPVYYNIGNAYYKAGEYPKAILNWERALKLNPSYKDARYNLEFAQSQIKDKIDELPEFILTSLARKLSYLVKSNTWAVISIILFALVLALLFVYLQSEKRWLKKTGFYGAIFALLLCATTFGFAKWQASTYKNSNEAIIMRPVSSIKSSPSAESSKDLFVLHEGTKVKVLDQVGEWYNISLADGRQGWILASDLEKI